MSIPHADPEHNPEIAPECNGTTPPEPPPARGTTPDDAQLARWSALGVVLTWEDRDPEDRLDCCLANPHVEQWLDDWMLETFADFHPIRQQWLKIKAGYRRLGGDTRLLDEAVHTVLDARRPDAPPQAIVVSMETVTAQPTAWLWWPYIAVGTTCLLDGDPGIGKSLLMTHLAASLSRGYPLPDQQGQMTLETHGPHVTLMLSTEDSLPHTLRPRLDKAGADASKIKVLTGWIDAQATERAFTLQHLDVLEAEIHRYQPRLVLIDPITAYMGTIDIHRANEVQELMGQLNRLADRTHCAIVGIRHPAKPGQHIGKVIHRGLGSVGFVGTARTALFAEQHPTRAGLALLGQSKSNMERLGRTQLFSKDQGTFEWCGVSRISAEVLGGTGRGPDPTAFLEAVFWLEDRLKDGLPQASIALGAEADEAGIAFRTLRRAKQALQIRSIKRGPDPQGKEAWDWQLGLTGGNVRRDVIREAWSSVLFLFPILHWHYGREICCKSGSTPSKCPNNAGS
jgi:hypothetical protein